MPQKLEDLFSAEEIESMSEEERAAFEEELEEESEGEEDTSEQGEEGETKGETATEEEEEKGEGEGEQDGEDGVKEEPEEKEDDIPEDKPSEQSQQAPETKPDQKVEEKEIETVQDENAEKKEQFQEELKTLREKFEEGEITFEDYLDERDSIKDQVREMEVNQKVLEAITRDKQLSAEQEASLRWQNDQEAFFENNKDISDDTKLYKTFAKQANAKINDPDYASVSNKDLLEEAAREARAIKGVETKSGDGKPESQALAKNRQKANKAASEKKVDTLADAPASDGERIDEGEFAHLDRLLESGKSEEAERLIAKMTPEQQDRYARQ